MPAYDRRHQVTFRKSMSACGRGGRLCPQGSEAGSQEKESVYRWIEWSPGETHVKNGAKARGPPPTYVVGENDGRAALGYVVRGERERERARRRPIGRELLYTLPVCGECSDTELTGRHHRTCGSQWRERALAPRTRGFMQTGHGSRAQGSSL